MKTFMTTEDLERLESSFGTAAFGISVITIVGMMCAVMTLCSAWFCGDKCKGFMAKVFVVLSFVVFLVVSIIFMIVGSALIFVQTTFSEEWITEQCNNAVLMKYDDMKLGLQVTDVDVSEMFKEIVVIDDKLG